MVADLLRRASDTIRIRAEDVRPNVSQTVGLVHYWSSGLMQYARSSN